VFQAYRVIIHREQGGAPPRSLLQVITEPVGAVLARDSGNAVRQMYRVIVHRGQARSYKAALLRWTVWAAFQLAREAVAAVYPGNRVIVHREQGGAPPRSLLQLITEPVGAVLARDSGDAVRQMYRVIVHRGQARLQQIHQPLLERGLPAIQALRSVRHTALSFIASKVERHPGRSYRKAAPTAVHRRAVISPRDWYHARLFPTGTKSADRFGCLCFAV